MFTKGRILFIVFFITVFVIGMIWAYSKDKAVNKIHFSKSYKVLIAILVMLLVQFLIVKFGKFI